MSIRKEIKELIKQVDAVIAKENVVYITFPKDVAKIASDANKVILEHLNQIVNIIDDARLKTLNRAREEISFEKHDKVYDKLDDYFSTNKTDEECEKWLEENESGPKNWAEAWIEMMELTAILEKDDE